MASAATEKPEEGIVTAVPHAIANPFGRVLARFRWNPFQEMEPLNALFKPSLIGEEEEPEGAAARQSGTDSEIGVLTISGPGTTRFVSQREALPAGRA